MSEENIEIPKPRWFKFFFIYKQAFEELNSRRCKKLIIAICEYAESNKIPSLDKKTMNYFYSFMHFYDMDKEISSKNGYKGANKRWNNQHNRVAIKKNRQPNEEK